MTKPPLSPDAALALGLARTAVPLSMSEAEEAERWLRVLRMNGRVGSALQALGVGEAPLEAPVAESPEVRTHRGAGSRDTVAVVGRRACELAYLRGARLVGTVDLLFSVMEHYGPAFERELYRRGTSRDELLERLAGMPAAAG